MERFVGTKGKWCFDDLEMKIKGTGDIEGMTVIANVSPKMNYSRGMTTQCANAQLIASAPDMLSLLIEMTKRTVDISEIKDMINKALGK